MILDSELQGFKSLEVSEAATNGSRMSANQVISGVVQNVFPHVLRADRLAGLTTFRKLFLKVSNDTDETLLSPQYWLDRPTAADDWAILFAGTQRNTQGDITGTERIYGAANLSTDAAAAGSTLVVTVEDASIVGMFAAGDAIRVTDMVDPDSITGNEEFHTINGAPVVVGSEITITTTDPLANSYTVAGGARVMSIYAPGDIACTVDSWIETSTAGTYDEGSYPVITDNIGTVDEDWTLTFTDANSFTVSGDSLGSVGSGNITTNFVPTNPDWSKPYFTLEFAGFGGTWAAGETITFTTHPAAVPIWEKRIVPAGAASMANNRIVQVTSGESA